MRKIKILRFLIRHIEIFSHSGWILLNLSVSLPLSFSNWNTRNLFNCQFRIHPTYGKLTPWPQNRSILTYSLMKIINSNFRGTKIKLTLSFTWSEVKLQTQPLVFCKTTFLLNVLYPLTPLLFLKNL